MKFKIDTRERFSIITILTDLFDANLAETITSALQLTDEHTSSSIILEMQQVVMIDDAGMEGIANLYRSCYTHHTSCCLAAPQKEVIKKLEQKGLELNMAPTLQEAIDVVMMEEIERELLDLDEGEDENKNA